MRRGVVRRSHDKRREIAAQATGRADHSLAEAAHFAFRRRVEDLGRLQAWQPRSVPPGMRGCPGFPSLAPAASEFRCSGPKRISRAAEEPAVAPCTFLHGALPAFRPGTLAATFRMGDLSRSCVCKRRASYDGLDGTHNRSGPEPIETARPAHSSTYTKHKPRNAGERADRFPSQGRSISDTCPPTSKSASPKGRPWVPKKAARTVQGLFAIVCCFRTVTRPGTRHSSGHHRQPAQSRTLIPRLPRRRIRTDTACQISTSRSGIPRSC
ncbi:hypothetical protein J2S89_000541 [Arthrobacter bambusae]|nr:hypothetical protein [Arthrobacter bambusae]MDQ0096474.1 hypothetical protein [Arthrobacter bambusae]